MKQQQFVSLHHHTTFSYMDGFGMPEAHVNQTAALGQRAQAVTEHGNVTSHVKHEQACQQAGIKPLFGLEAYTGPVGEEQSRFKWHLTLLAETQEGYRNLLRATSQGWDDFYYEPTISGDTLAEYSEGLIVLSGCSGSLLATTLLGGKGTPEHEPDRNAAYDVAMRFREAFGDAYYLEVQQFPELDKTRLINEAYSWLSDKTGIPIVATADAHYPLPNDNLSQVLLHAIDRGGKNHSFEKQQQSWGYDVRLTTHRDKMMLERMVNTGLSKKLAREALHNTGLITDRCTITLPKLKELQFPGENDARQMFRAEIKRGWKYRGFHRLPAREQKVLKKRIKYEAGLIELKQFCDYFLVVSDVVVFAKDNGIAVGPARGSAAASLVCYLMRITEVNPMLFANLLFERFIDINRHDLPDIDLDFDDEQRWRIRAYLVDKYGEEHVGNIGTFTKFKGKNSLDDVARVHHVPKWATDAIKEKLIDRSSGDLRGSSTIEDTIEMFPDVKKVFEQYPVLYEAQTLEGNMKGFSVHAAGLVVANEPLTNSCAIYTRRDPKTQEVRLDQGGRPMSVLSIDKHDAEYINALKIDVLGLKTMGAISTCLEMIGLTLEELYAVPLDDEKVYAGFRRNEVVGLFQFDGRAMRSVNREVKPDNFAEVCDINALARPGPLHSGAAAEYIMAKHKKKKIEILHPVVGRITKHTQGQIVYQEQILQTVRELGNFSWEEAARIRKIISKKEGEQEFNRQMGKFIKGCAENGVPEIKAARIWKQLVTAGAYAFNAAHCVSYGMLAYWTMWLKQNYPLEFYCSSLRKYDPKTKGFDLLQEALAKDIDVLPPHPRKSEATWTYDKKKNALRAGFEQIRGIAEKTSGPMVAYRDANRIREWADFINVRGIGPKTIEAIEDFCAEEDPFGVYRLGRTLKRVRQFLWDHGDEYDIPFPESKSEDVPYEAIRGTHIWVGFIRDRNLKDIYELHRSRTGEELDPASVREPEYVNYVVLTGEDETGPLVVTVHRYGGLYEKFKDMIWNMDVKKDVLVVKGYKRSEYRRAIYATDLWVLRGK